MQSTTATRLAEAAAGDAMYQGLLALAGEASWTFGILLVFLASGSGVAYVLGASVRFRMLMAPLAGLLLVNTATLALYFVFHLALATALVSATLIAMAASLVVLVASGFPIRLGQTAACLALLALASTGFTWLSETATITNHSPSVTYLDGLDTLSYAQIADWMRDHVARPEVHAPPGTVRPRADPAVPYESLPDLLFGNEPRTGAFAFLGVIGTLRSLPSAFAFDPACAVVLASAVLGVAAVFAGNWLTLAALILGLTVSHWYDYTQAGYFAKSLAYPSILFLSGLWLKTRGSAEFHILALLCVFAAASALLLTGLLTAAALIVICAPAICASSWSQRRVDWQEFSRLGLCAFVAVLASGYFEHPTVAWERLTFGTAGVGPRSLDLEGWNAITGFGEATLVVMIVVALACATILGRAAVLSRQSGPATLLLSPVALYFALLILHLRPELMQATGLLYPIMLCGAVWLLSDVPRLPRGLPLAVLAGSLAVMIGLRVPRALTAAARYTGEAASESFYSKDELDAVAALVADRTVLIDLGKVSAQQCVLIFVEFGRRGVSMQWTAESWYWPVGSWRHWPVPNYDKKPDLLIVAAGKAGTTGVLYAGRHFAITLPAGVPQTRIPIAAPAG